MVCLSRGHIPYLGTEGMGGELKTDGQDITKQKNDPPLLYIQQYAVISIPKIDRSVEEERSFSCRDLFIMQLGTQEML